MTTANDVAAAQRAPELLGQTSYPITRGSFATAVCRASPEYWSIGPL
jgi:hypothetical protein